MLEASLRDQLRTYLDLLQQPVELVLSLDESPTSAQLLALAETLVSLSPRLSLRTDGQAQRRPQLQITRPDQDVGVAFAALPLGHEFSSLVLALLHVGGHPPKADPAALAAARSLDRPIEVQTWMNLSCHNCPEVVQAFNTLAAVNPRVRHVAIDGSLFAAEAEARGILAVPTVYVNGQAFGSGRMSFEEIVARLDERAAHRSAEALSRQAPFDVLVIGAGPAGAAAAIYTARKGIRTGLAAERIGGQTLDTLAIENYISVRQTEGPRFASDLERHVRDYEVEWMPGQRAVAVEPAPRAGGTITVRFASGAELKTRTLILATGARWRTLGVPGEEHYRNRGVTFCPHCDGPLFRNKRVAVIGGGNSGVEAAIDLAGIVEQVSLLEFAPELKADRVLIQRLERLPNVTVIRNAQTTEIVGNGQQVTALRYRDRASGQLHELPLAGVFVQIGLVPNTDWLRGVVPLNRFGEIEVDAKGATGVPGIFAAGDATTVPYKQIVIAAGEGAKAALGAFDYLIRNS
ncbi:MAG: alkyl hydroperoxide reductase subunit F [Casimicrobiaceae bacterium]|nr:alkyl hydroperoxide reductase subunit F [Casimicrobiaceae bacterium]MCX8098944.1 alkyl hydroperoxide reductase subunit F [Casimicrobiaceae bacterium]MDW8313133.1 alkyl hydroperoxide reductase subunit F [Burkholderiales bacterium]